MIDSQSGWVVLTTRYHPDRKCPEGKSLILFVKNIFIDEIRKKKSGFWQYNVCLAFYPGKIYNLDFDQIKWKGSEFLTLKKDFLKVKFGQVKEGLFFGHSSKSKKNNPICSKTFEFWAKIQFATKLPNFESKFPFCIN